MTITTMPEVLRWRGGEDVLDAIHRDYMSRLADGVGRLLAAIGRHDRGTGERLVAGLGSLPDHAFLRLVSAPEVSCRALWPGRHRVEDSARFLEGAIAAERARLGLGPAPRAELWTACGDTRIAPYGAVQAAPVVEGVLPIDLDSPYACGIALEGQDDRVARARQPLTGEERNVALDRMGRAAGGIRVACPEAWRVVVGFTKALILQRDPDAPGMFSSGSTAQYVGRSVLGNPQLPMIDEVYLAEGLVHEAIHSVLYMQELDRPWVASDELYAPIPRVTSPWTGTRLPLRPYLQACFVWYGLLHFWGRALVSGAFPHQKARARVTTAASGFASPELMSQLEPYEVGIAEELLDAVDDMRLAVVDYLEAVA